MKNLISYILLILPLTAMLTGCAGFTGSSHAMAHTSFQHEEISAFAEYSEQSQEKPSAFNYGFSHDHSPDLYHDQSPDLNSDSDLYPDSNSDLYPDPNSDFNHAPVSHTSENDPQPERSAERITFIIKQDASLNNLEKIQDQVIQSNIIDPSKPMVALTFDDGPSEYTAQIIDILDQYNAMATFCIIGVQAEPRRDIIARAFEAGCEIIGHSWSHSNLALLPEQQIEREILDTNLIIESITGQVPQIYRVPYGAINTRVRQVSQRLGFSIVAWSVDPKDWMARDAGLIGDAIMADVHDGAIIICHDTHEATAEAMKRVIPKLIEEGYQMVTVSDLFTYKGIELEPGKVYRHANY